LAVVATTSALTIAGSGMATSAVSRDPAGGRRSSDVLADEYSSRERVDRQLAAVTGPLDHVIVTTDPSGSTKAAAQQAFVMYGPRDDDDPKSIPIGTPIALLFIAAALVFIPSLFS
jgi:hypothetical protein